MEGGSIKIERTILPSTSSAVPVMAEACSEAKKTTRLATSIGLRKHFSREVGKMVWNVSFPSIDFAALSTFASKQTSVFGSGSGCKRGAATWSRVSGLAGGDSCGAAAISCCSGKYARIFFVEAENEGMVRFMNNHISHPTIRKQCYGEHTNCFRK